MLGDDIEFLDNVGNETHEEVELRDAFFIANHVAVKGQSVSFEATTDDEQSRTEFLMLKDGRVAFEGTASELRASTDPYLRAFLS